VFSSQELADLTSHAVRSVDSNDLAYLVTTGKSEHPIRDLLGAHLTKQFPSLTAAREYQRRDLVVLENGQPLAMIEGKLWISFEANFPSKLHNPNPKEGLIAAAQSDIAKMKAIHVATGCQQFTSTVLYAADIRQLDERHLSAVKYSHWLRRGLTDGADLEVAHSLGVRNFVDAISPFGLTASARLFRGQAFGMTVIADVIIGNVAHPYI